MEEAGKRWNSIAKPLHSLGRLEEDIIKVAGMTGNADVRLDKKALIVMCADNGVVEEGVTQTGQEFNLVIEGTVVVTWADKEFELNAGDSIYFNPEHPHGQRCGGDIPAKFVTIIAE